MKIDRMEVDDAGGNPVKLANSILQQLDDVDSPVPVEEIALQLGIITIEDRPLNGLEGVLVVLGDKSEGAISVREGCHPRRRTFTIAHELGHFVNPWHMQNSPEGFRCTLENLTSGTAGGDRLRAKMELQANEFASELILPTSGVEKLTDVNGYFDLLLARSIADKYQVSYEATLRRLVNLSGEPCAIVFSKLGKVRYTCRSSEFPHVDVRSNQPLPIGSISAAQPNRPSAPTDFSEVDSGVWLSSSTGTHILEQTVGQRDGFRITLLILDDG